MLNQLRLIATAIALWPAMLLSLSGSLAVADNLTNLASADPSLLSQGTPDDVFNTLEFDYGPNGRELRDNIDNANGVTGGWTMNATFTPTANDLAVGETRLIMEIGGTANGTGLWLIDGIPTLALKSYNSGGAVPSSFVANDLDITDGAAAIYSSFGPLAAGQETTVAASWDANNGFVLAVQDNVAQLGVRQSVRVTGAHNEYNWYGNSTFLEGDLAGGTGSYGGLSGAVGNPFTDVDALSFEGSFNGNDTLFWNAPATITLADPAKEVLTLSVNLDTRNVRLINPTNAPVEFNGYELIGGRGGFVNDSNWQKLAENDADPWMTSNPEGVQKSIGETTATGGFTLAANGGFYDFGDVWATSPFVDVAAQIDLAGGGSVNALVEYTGAPGVYGDYDESGAVDAGDWPFILANLVSDVSALDGIGEYLSGDLTGDGLVNRDDFRMFKQLLAAGSGASGGRLVPSVPEPSTSVLLLAVGLAVAFAAPRRKGGPLVLTLLAVGVLSTSATAADIYFVSTSGEIKVFSGVAAGGTPVDGNTFAGGGTLVNSIAAYGSYQGFTSIPDGRVFGINSTGGVDSWPTISDWTNNLNMSSLSSGVYGSEVSQTSGIHGISFDANTGGFYGVLEGPTNGLGGEGDLVQYATLPDFINNTNPDVFLPRAYNGNIANFYYPDEDAPAISPSNADAEPGSNYFQITGGGQLEGWLDLFSPGFGYFGPGGTPGGGGGGGNRSYQLPGFGNNIADAFAVVEPIDELTLVVDTATGVVGLQRASTSRTIDYLEISSPGGGLLTGDGYLGLGANAEFPQGDGTASSTGWDLAPSNSTGDSLKSEYFAFGSSDIVPGASLIPLGLFYDTAQDSQDLRVSFDEVSGDNPESITVGGLFVEYVATAGLAGDYNGDGSVDAADYVLLRANEGGSGASLQNRSLALNGAPVGAVDYLVWKANFGATVGSGAALAADQAVPEPTSLGLLLPLIAWLAAVRRRS